MKNLEILLPLAVLSCYWLKPAKAEEKPSQECRPVFLTISEVSLDASKIPSESAKVFINCNGSRLDIPRNTSLHMMLAKPDGFCYADFSCGNLEAWQGFFSVGVSAGFGDTLENFLNYGMFRFPIPTQPVSVFVKMSVEWGTIQNFCTQQSEPVCFSYR
jgi:hypothetical protein